MKSRWMACVFALVLGCSEGEGIAASGEAESTTRPLR